MPLMLTVKQVYYHKDYQLFVELSDGSQGYFDVYPYTDKGIFDQLLNIEYLVVVILKLLPRSYKR